MTISQNNKSTGRFGRIVQFPVTRIVLAFLVVSFSIVVAQVVLAMLPFGGETDVLGRVMLTQPIVGSLPFGLALKALLAAAIIVLASYGAFSAYAHFVERRDLVELAPAGALKELGSGMLTGALLVTVTVCVMAVLGAYKVVGFNDWSILIIPLASSTISAFVEEILFRGVLFKIIEESLGTWLALLISAVVFGLGHLFNPGANLIGPLAIVAGAGVLLVAAYVLTRRLWLAMGIHFAWNFTQAIFGIAEEQGLLQASVSGPDWLTGGTLGESVVTAVVCLIVGFYFIAKATQKGHMIQPFWRRVSQVANY